MHYRFPGLTKALGFALFLTPYFSEPCLALSRTPHRTTLAIAGVNAHLNHARGLSAAAAISLADRETIAPITVRTIVYGEGRAEIFLPIKRNFTGERSFTTDGREIQDATKAAFFQGKIALGGGIRKSASPRVSSAALSIINNKLRITFLGRSKGSKGRQRLYTIHTELGDTAPTTARVTSVPSRAGKNGGCSTPVEDIAGLRHSHQDASATAQEGITAQALVAARVATLSTDADPEWYAKFGSESNAEILRVINTSEALFFRNFGVTFRIVKQHTYTDTSPYTSTRADYLLSQFVRNPENPLNLGVVLETFDTDVDLKHLFSGKTLDSNILGIAYIGSLCATSHLAYGVTQAHLFDATFGIFSHEISHSLGAFHDPAAPGTIMYPSISIPPANIYSARSLSEIRGFLLRSNSCLSKEFVDRPAGDIPGSIENPVLVPRTLTLKRQVAKTGKLIRLSGALTEGTTTSITGTNVNLIVKNSVLATSTTDGRGRYSFTVPSRLFSTKGTAVYAATEDWGTISKPLSISAARSRR